MLQSTDPDSKARYPKSLAAQEVERPAFPLKKRTPTISPFPCGLTSISPPRTKVSSGLKFTYQNLPQATLCTYHLPSPEPGNPEFPL